MQAVFFALGPAADQIRDKVGANSAAAEGTLSVSEEVAWTVDEAADAETSELRKREVDADEGQVGGTKQGWASVHPPVMSSESSARYGVCVHLSLMLAPQPSPTSTSSTSFSASRAWRNTRRPTMAPAVSGTITSR